MRKLLLFGTILCGSFLAGCASNQAYGAVRFGPPPAPRYGAMGYAPGPGYVWTDGYWNWHGNRWTWVNGRWMRPPHAHAVWVPGVWVEDHHHWGFRRGYWR